MGEINKVTVMVHGQEYTLTADIDFTDVNYTAGNFSGVLNGGGVARSFYHKSVLAFFPTQIFYPKSVQTGM